MRRPDSVETPWFSRLLREPTLQFFAMAALVLVGHRLVMGNPRTIAITPALKADLLRRYHDQLNRAPTSEEADEFMAAWKVEEALYREALREGIDRDDATVRNVLIARMRERALLGARVPEPTDADLQQYLERHRDQFEAPLIYEHEYVVFPKGEPGAARERTKAERELKAGATPASLGLRSVAANVDRARIEHEFGPKVADDIRRLPVGQWHELEASDRHLLVKMIRVQGGLPEPGELHARLVAAWKGERQQNAAAQTARTIAERYHFDEPSR